ncbi:MAG: efflux transporter periplasmic adaptor subunit [Proteobacteria bacterium]|nr:efflux transporter periplasmic adaptor subunit [Pseudomonadota bacterium]
MPASKFRVALAGAALAVAAAVAVAWMVLRAAPVETQIAAEGVIPVQITGPGTVDARIPVTLSARITATVAKLHADQGDAVKQGQILVSLDDRELDAKRAAATNAQETVARNIAAAKAAVAKAEAELDLARSKFRRDQDLARSAYISQSGLDTSAAALRAGEATLENAKANLAARESEARGVAHDARYADTVLSHTRITAPMDAIVVERLAEVGSTVVPGTPLFRLVDPATVWVAVRVDESVVGRVKLGQPARIRLRTGEELGGTVARIARQSDTATRELEVDVAFDAPPERFTIDQEAQVTIRAGEEHGVVVPVSALVENAGKPGVLVVTEGRARFRPVQAGAADAMHVVVRKGVAAGEVVIVKPAGVKPGARVAPTAPPS